MEKNTLQSALNEFSQGTTDNIDSIMIKDAAVGRTYTCSHNYPKRINAI